MVGGIPTNNKLNSTYESYDPLTSFHLRSFFGLRCRRSVRSISLLLSSLLGLVRKTTSDYVYISDTLRTSVPHVQYPTAVLQCAFSHHQLRYLVYAHYACIRDVQRLRDKHVHDFCCITGTQSTIERSERRCRCGCYCRNFLLDWRYFNGQFCEFCC
jgi:hypothetical protein